MEFQKGLTTRQWKLYSFLKKKYDYINLKDIILETGFYGEYVDSVNCTATRRLKKDIRALKDSDVIQYVILSSSDGIKIATREEYINYSKRRWKALARAIRLQQKQDKKAGLDNQLRLVFNQEKDVIEAFREVNA